MLTTTQIDFTIKASALINALSAVRHAISREETRYYLQGVYMHEHDGDLRFVATDGHRMAISTVEGVVGIASMPPFLWPRKLALSVLGSKIAHRRHLQKDVTISVQGNILTVTFPATGEVISGDALDGVFPDYRRVVPDDDVLKHVVQVNREIFAKAVRSVQAFSEALYGEKEYSVNSYTGVAIEVLEKQVLVTAKDEAVGSAVCSTPLLSKCEPIKVGFNGNYLLDIIGLSKAEVFEIKFQDPGSPAVIEQGKTKYIVMPKRI